VIFSIENDIDDLVLSPLAKANHLGVNSCVSLTTVWMINSDPISDLDLVVGAIRPLN